MLLALIEKIQTSFLQQEMQKSLGWLNTLPEMAELDVLIETRQHLVKIEFNAMAQAKLNIDIVLEIDKNTARYARKETHKYLTTLKINKKLELSIYNAAYLYYRQLYVSYTQFLACYQNQTKVKCSEEKIHLVLCRLLHATFAMAKWRYFDDQPAPAGTWTTVHNVIKFAENLSIMNKNIFLYSYHKKETSIAALLKQGFMMDTLHKGNYSRLQIQLTEKILNTWATNPLIYNRYQIKKMHFCISLKDDKGPERIRTIEKFVDYRFWKTTRVVDLIEAYICAVETQKPLTEFGLDKIAPASVVFKLFKKLRAEWCIEGFERQRRGENRFRRSKLLSISHGLPEVCHRLMMMRVTGAALTQAHLVDAEIAEFEIGEFDMKVAEQRRHKLNTPTYQENSTHQEAVTQQGNVGSENWWMVDESNGGFAVDLGREVNHWVEPGKLVAYTTVEDKSKLVIAEIRSVRKQLNGNFRAGLAELGAQANLVKVARVELNNTTEVQSDYMVHDGEMDMNQPKLSQFNAFDGVLLEQARYAKPNTLSLIIPRSEFKRGAQFIVQFAGKEQLIEVGVLQIKQREWVSIAIPMMV